MKGGKGTVKLILIPRLIAIAFILFLTLFSLDVFTEGGSIFKELVGFIIHSLPSLLMIAVLAFNWRNPHRCGLMFLAIGALFTLRFGTFRRLDTFVLISVPPLLVGGLFLLADKLQKKGSE